MTLFDNVGLYTPLSDLPGWNEYRASQVRLRSFHWRIGKYLFPKRYSVLVIQADDARGEIMTELMNVIGGSPGDE